MLKPVNNVRMDLYRMFRTSAAALLIGPAGLQAQPTITAADFFNQPGQYYRAYANAPGTTADVSTLLGTASAEAQAWNFTLGPRDVVYRFDYLAASSVPAGTNFPAAVLVEQKTEEPGAAIRPGCSFPRTGPGDGWCMGSMNRDGARSRCWVSSSSSNRLPACFRPRCATSPDPIHYGDEWTSTTSYTNTLTLDIGGGDDDEFGIGGLADFLQQTTYNATAKVDAFGVINSPGIGFGECLRINELVQYDLAVDLGSGFEHLGTAYLRNYYWVRPGRGVVVQVTSEQQQGVPPPNDFTAAAVLLRMFETNHPDPGPPPPQGIQGLSLTLGPEGGLLTWNRLSGVTSYQVEYTEDPGRANTWQPLGTATTSNFRIDATANKPGNPVRYYRVVGSK
ncbi:MAG: hypothetical protein M5U12_03460 [Verrucomicrobia bacterium]|nr:hypothetical protein [Verrucomicrobiota bacterium]